jgi:hypothetical protein
VTKQAVIPQNQAMNNARGFQASGETECEPGETNRLMVGRKSGCMFLAVCTAAIASAKRSKSRTDLEQGINSTGRNDAF